MTKPADKLYSIQDAASYLGLSTKTLRRWEESGRLEAQRTSGGHRRYSLSDLKKAKRHSRKYSHIPAIEAPQQVQLMPATIEPTFQSFKQTLPEVSQTITPPPTEPIYDSTILTDAQLEDTISAFSLSDQMQDLSHQPENFTENISRPVLSKKIYASFAVLVIAALLLTSGLGHIKHNIDKASKQKLALESVAGTDSSVLALQTSLENLTFDVNVNSRFAENVNISGDLTTNSTEFNLINTTATTLNIGGEASALSIGAATGDTTINNNLIVAQNITGEADLTITGIATLPTIVTGTDTITDFTGTGLTVTNGVLNATVSSLGDSIETGEIVDGTILETDLNISNTAVNGYTLVYNSTTGGFTWTDSSAVIHVQNNDVEIGASVDTIDFSTLFSVTASPTTETNITIANNALTATQLAATLTFADGDFLDLSAIAQDDATPQGIKLPQNTSLTAISGGGEGYIAYNTTTQKPYYFNGTTWTDFSGSTSSFSLIGSAGTTETINDGDQLSILGGTNGIDTIASNPDTITINLNTTEIGTTTFGSGSGIVWTFDASVGTDPTLTFADNSIAVSANLSLADGKLLNLSAITQTNGANEGIILPELDNTLDLPASGAGYIAYNTVTSKPNYYNGAAWVDFSGASTTLQEAYDADVDGSDSIITLSTADDSIVFRNPDATGTDSAFNLQIDNLATGVTTANFKNLNVTEAGSFNTTAGVLTNYGGYFSNTSTRSAGANALTNVGLYATATGAQNNYAAIFESGNVGIGTTTPTYDLHVTRSANQFVNVTSGSTSSGTSGGASLVAINDSNVFGRLMSLGSGYTTSGILLPNSVHLYSSGATNGLFVGTADATDLKFVTGGQALANERARFLSTGELGIGTTSPGKQVEINNATGQNLRLTYNDSNGSAADYTDFTLDTNGNLTISPTTDGGTTPGTVNITGTLDVTAGINAATADAFQVSSAGAIAAVTGFTQNSGVFSSTLTTTNSASFGSTTANTDSIAIKPQTTTATNSFTGTITSLDLTDNRTYSLQNADGTLAFLTDIPTSDNYQYWVIGGDTGSDINVTSTYQVDFVGTNGIATTIAANQLSIAGVDATTSTKGVASFNDSYFAVASGDVTIDDIYLRNNGDTGTGNYIFEADLDLGNAATDTISLIGSLDTGVNFLDAATGVAYAITGSDATGAGNAGGNLSFVAGAGLTTGGGGNAIFASGDSPSGTDGYLSFLTGGSSGDERFRIQADGTFLFEKGANDVTLAITAPTGAYTLTLPSLTNNADLCTTLGNCAGTGGGVTTPGGNANRVAKFTAGSTIGDSSIQDDGTTITLDNDITLTNTNRTITDAGSIVDLNLTLGADADTDVVSALNIDVTSAATGDADQLFAINLANLTSADATVLESALRIGSGWDSIFSFEGATDDGDDYYITVSDPNAGDVTVNLPIGVSGDFCFTSGNCAGSGSGVTAAPAGTIGQIAYFATNGQNITSEASGFGWDATNNLFTIDGLTTATTANTATLAQASNTLTSGGLFDASLTSSALSAAFTGEIGAFGSTRTYSGAGTITDTGNVLELTRASTNGGAGTYEVQGALLNITNSATQSSGTLTDSANLLSVTQDADATGALIYLNANRTGNSNTLLFEQSLGGTDILSLQDDGDLAILGDLTVTGGGILGAASFDLLNTVSTTINFGGAATTFNIGPTGASGSIALSGGSSDTGCTLDGTTGNLTCSGTLTGSTGVLASTLQDAYNNDPDGSDSLITLSNSDDSLIFRNPSAGTGTDSAFTLQIDNIDIALTTANYKNLYSTQAGTFDTTAGNLTNYGGYFANTSTESGGGNVLTNVGLYATASGGDTNYALIVPSGGGQVGIGTSTPDAGTDLDLAGIQNSSTNDQSFLFSHGTIKTGNRNYNIFAESNTDGLTATATNAPAGVVSRMLHTGSGTMTEFSNFLATDLIQNAVTVTSLKGYNSQLSVTTSGTLTNAYNFYSTTPTNSSGTLTNAYGLYLENMNTASSLNYAIYSAGGQSYHAGNFGVGDSDPVSLLTVGASDAFQVNSSGNIVNIGGAAHSIANSSGALNIDSATTGAINLGTGANAKTITIGNNTGATALNFTSGTGLQTFTSSAATTGAFSFLADSISSATAFSLSADALTSGKAFDISSTSTGISAISTSGFLGNYDWSPSGSTEIYNTGDLFALNVGQYGNVGNILNIKDNGSSVFSVSQAQITSALPHQFTSPGDVGMAYDLIFTNQTASYIKSYAPLYIEAGESSESNDLTLRAYNSGDIVVDTPGNLLITSTDPGIVFDTTTATDTDFWAAVVEDAGGDDDDYFQIGDGTVPGTNPFLSINTSGQVGIGDTSPSSLLEVGNGTDSIQFNTTGDITFVDADGGASITGPAGGALSIDAALTGLNLQADGSIDVNIAGGSGATGCTIANSTGNLTCSGTITSGGTAAVLGSGTDNVLPRWNGTGSTLQDSGITDDDTTISLTANRNFVIPAGTSQVGIGSAVTSDYLVNLDSTSTNDFSRALSITQAANSTSEVSSGIYIDSTPNLGTVSSFTNGARGYTSVLTPTVTIGNDSSPLFAAGRNYLDIGSVSFNPSSGDSFVNLYGSSNVITGNPVVNTTGGGSNELWMYGVTSSVTSTPTLTAVASGTYLDYKGGRFATDITSAGNANLTVDVTGVSGIASGNLTTTGTTAHYGGIFTALGTADNNYGLYVNSSGATNNYGLYFSGAPSTASIGSAAATDISVLTGTTGALSLDTGTTGAINIGTNANAKAITIGNTSNTSPVTFNSGVATTATTSSAWVFTDNALTSGTGGYVNSSSITQGNLFHIATATGADTLTSGNLLKVSSDLANSTFTGNLALIDWSPDGSTEIYNTTADLLQINAGTYANVGYLLNVSDDSSTVFGVSQSQITSALPHQFTAPGDVSIAYDIQFTNQTASYIKSKAPLYIDTGESFESNDLTLRTYNLGQAIFDAPGGLDANVSNASTTAPGLQLTYNGTGSSFRVNDDGTTSDSTPFIIDGSGNVAIGKTSASAILDAAGNAIFGTSSGTTSITLNSGSSRVGTISQEGSANSSPLILNSNGVVQLKTDNVTWLTVGESSGVNIGTDTVPNSLFTVGNASEFQVNSSGNIVSLGGVAHSIADSSGALNIDSATTGAINLGTGANAKTITIGNNTGATALAFTSGTGAQTFTSGASTTGAFAFVADSISSGTGFDLSFDALAGGKGINLTSTSTGVTTGNLFSSTLSGASTFSGNLNLFEFSGAATATGDLVRINIGSSSNVGNLLNITDNGSTLFKVNETQITSALPHEFTAAGDVTMAYDLIMTNQTASFIKSYGPITLEAGESFENNNLTLKSYGTGLLNVDAAGGSLFTRSGGTVGTFNRTTDDGTIISLQQAGTEEGTISVSGTTVSYNAFTGSHYAWTNADIQKGKLVSLTGTNHYSNNNPESEIIYGIGETFIKNDSKVLGAYLSVLNPSDPRSDQNPSLVMAVGNGVMWVADNGSDLQPGDMLISSDLQGHAEKDTGEFETSFIVARVAEPVVWGSVTDNINGRKHKLISVLYDVFAKANTASQLANITPMTNEELSLRIAEIENSLKTGELKIENLSKLTVTDLTVIGNAILPDTVINGKLNVGTLTLDNINNSIDAIGTLKIQTQALGDIEFLNGLAVLDKEGNFTAQSVTADKYKVAGASAGTSTLVAGDTYIDIDTDQVTDQSLIFVTPKQALAYPMAVTQKTKGVGFRVEVQVPEQIDIMFDWFIVDKVDEN